MKQKRNIQKRFSFVWQCHRKVFQHLSLVLEFILINVDVNFVGRHAGDECVFWPDLASFYYANETTQWLLQEKIKFLAKQINPANVRKVRPIEDVWLILTDKVDEEAGK